MSNHRLRTGWRRTCVRDFLRSGLAEQIVTLRAADRRDALDFECASEPQTVRLVRHIAPNGQARVLMTHLFDVARFQSVDLASFTTRAGASRRRSRGSSIALAWNASRVCPQLAVVQDTAA